VTFLPAAKSSGTGLLELHKHEAILVNAVMSSFNQRRIYWHDEAYELRFLPPSDRKRVCVSTIETANTAVRQAVGSSSGGTGAELKLIDLLLTISPRAKLAADQFLEIPEKDAYNTRVLNTGGDSSEKMSDEEHRELYHKVIRDLRVQTYPLWESIIDLLPSGLVFETASKNLETGRNCFTLDRSEIEQPLEIDLEVIIGSARVMPSETESRLDFNVRNNRKWTANPSEPQSGLYGFDSSLEIAIDFESFSEPSDSRTNARVGNVAGS
jgi:hypothetical protein